MYFTNIVSDYDAKKPKLNLVLKYASYFLSKKVKKKEFILKAGDVCEHMIFIRKGLLRVYLKNEDKEVNTWFAKEDEFIVSMNSFHYEIPSYEYIQAIEETEVILFKKSTYYFLLNNNHKLAHFALEVMYQYLCEYQNQCLALRFMTAEEKYEYLVTSHSDLVERLSQKHIASFLGIETTYLSKIIASYKALHP